MRIDLHVHSTASDGTVAPSDVVTEAHTAGLDVVALTDHDTLAGLTEAAKAAPAGMTIVPGAEISAQITEPDGRRTGVHLLGYLFDPAEPALAAELHRLRGERDRRAQAMIGKLQELGVAVTWDQVRRIAADAPVGRPHLAQAMHAAGATTAYEDAFTATWLAPGGRAYEPKRAIDAVAAVELVRAAGGVAVLAHPGGRRAVPPAAIVAMAAAGLHGLEVDHVEHDSRTRARLRGLARSLDLVVTGGSDYHGRVKMQGIGAELTAPAAYEALVAQASGAAPVRR